MSNNNNNISIIISRNDNNNNNNNVCFDAAIFHNHEGVELVLTNFSQFQASQNCFDKIFACWINWNSVIGCLMFGAFIPCQKYREEEIKHTRDLY